MRVWCLVILAMACERGSKTEPTPTPPPKDAAPTPMEPEVGPFDHFPRALLAELKLPAHCRVDGDLATCRDHPIGAERCSAEVAAGGGYVQIAVARCELGTDADAALGRVRAQMSALARYGSLGFDEIDPGREISGYFDDLPKTPPDPGTHGVGFTFHRAARAGRLQGAIEYNARGYSVTYEWSPIESDVALDIPDMYRTVVTPPHAVAYRPRDGTPYEVSVSIVHCTQCGAELEPAQMATAIAEVVPDERPPRKEQLAVGATTGRGWQWVYYVTTKYGGVAWANDYWLTTPIAGGQLVVVSKYRALGQLDDGVSKPDVAKLEARMSPAVVRAGALKVAEAYLRAHPPAK